MDNTLREFKDKQYKFVKENINNHKLNPITGWTDSPKKDLQKTKHQKKRY